jgi:quercetin dioxygenase-like cupin family protein
VSAGVALLALCALCASSAMAQDPAKVAPDMYKVRLDNARVRVLEVTGKAGQKAKLHKHPDYVVYNVSDGKVRFADAKGAATEGDLKAGEVMWRPAETHASEAVTDIHAMLFELKGPKRAGAARPAGAADPAADPAHFKVLLDNDRVRVLEFRARPGEKVPMHWHPDYITYDLNGGKTKFTYPKGSPAERVSKAGDVTWHKTETHAGEITGDSDVHILLVELK